ncbi:MAG TPA: hypothetical protein VIH57_23585, partial [Bacteroidales bacterium]
AEQINNALIQLNQVTQQNASASEELATNSEELANQAEHLREIISFFKLGENIGGQHSMISKPKHSPAFITQPKDQKYSTSSERLKQKINAGINLSLKNRESDENNKMFDKY